MKVELQGRVASVGIAGDAARGSEQGGDGGEPMSATCARCKQGWVPHAGCVCGNCMRPDTIAAVGELGVREADGLLVVACTCEVPPLVECGGEHEPECAIARQHIANAQMAEQEVAAYRERQIEQGIRKVMQATARKAAWYGRIQGALFVATAVFLWWVGSQL